MNRNELDFAIFCIESIAERLELSGADVYKSLSESSDLLDNYITPHYDTLHTQSKEYIVDELISIMRNEGVVQ